MGLNWNIRFLELYVITSTFRSERYQCKHMRIIDVLFAIEHCFLSNTRNILWPYTVGQQLVRHQWIPVYCTRRKVVQNDFLGAKYFDCL